MDNLTQAQARRMRLRLAIIYVSQMIEGILIVMIATAVTESTKHFIVVVLGTILLSIRTWQFVDTIT